MRTKLFNVWFRRISPQHFVTVVEAKDIEDAFQIAKDMGVLHPIVGETQKRRAYEE